MLVDDNPNIIAAYKRQFRKDFQFATANSGDEGLIINGTGGPFTVVISDYRMPGMNGIQFLKKSRNILRILSG